MNSLETFRHQAIAQLPTPLYSLPRLSQELNVDLWVKRDDMTGLAFGGNKTRKLEFLVADALAKGCSTLVTIGAIQSNHCRQTAAAAAMAGLDCELILVGEPSSVPQGNLLLDQILGATIHWTNQENQNDVFNQVMDNLQEGKAQPYRIPYGGSNPLGVAAYALAMKELLNQEKDFDHIIVASSSGGTQAGLLLGAALYGYGGEIIGISIEPSADQLRSIINDLLDETIHQFELDVTSEQFAPTVDDRFLGEGYAVVGDLERQAILRFALEDGLLLDPVYTGRAAGGLLNLIETGELEAGQRVLFWHTGGTPALFAFHDQLIDGLR